MIVLYAVVLFTLSVYTYALIDPNLSLMSNEYWVLFRDPMVQLGYHQRTYSWYLYLALLVGLYLFHFFFLRHYKKYNPLRLAFLIGGILFFSYPFLSHDFFNYIFDAKILTYYGENPYLHKPLDYPNDEWLRFMHWTHRSYPYGPTFLPITLIPSFLAMGKFILNYFLFKAVFIFFYIFSVYFLSKIERKSAIEFVTHPLILIEGVVSAHNDLIAVALAIGGFYYLLNKDQVRGRILLIFSALIKYTTLPLPCISVDKKSWRHWVVLVAQIGLLCYLIFSREIQQWYLLVLFAYLPLYPLIIRKSNVLLFGLLLSYYPYIYLGGWEGDEKMWWKHVIIGVFAGINVVYFFYERFVMFRPRDIISTKY